MIGNDLNLKRSLSHPSRELYRKEMAYVWRYISTHNRYFKTEEELLETLTSVFGNMQKHPDQIKGYLRPFL